MSEETIQNMERLIDDPSNGMMLQRDIHDNFDKLKIYLEQTERENEYVVREVRGRPWIHPRKLVDKVITFRNHDVSTQDLPLPSPHCIALHAGISRILHMSGASEVFAQILDKYDGAAGGNIGSLKSNGDPVRQLSSMISALFIGASLIT
jgi:siroheme synthase